MPIFQGSGFSLNLPEGSVDASAYCFAFPEAGDFSPNLTIQFERRREPADVGEEMLKLHRSLQYALEGFRVLSQANYESANGPYAYSISEWGAANARIRQMHVMLFATASKPTLYTLTATDKADNFTRSEPLFRQVIGSFLPNGLQCY